MLASLTSAVALGTPTVTAATPSSTLYVKKVSGCSDAGTGTAAVPFCTIQAAADVVEPGQTVRISAEQGDSLLTYSAFKLTRSGTPDAPIKFVGVNEGLGRTSPAQLSVSSGPDSAISLVGVHDVVLSHLTVDYWVDNAVGISGSSRITLDDNALSQANGTVGAGQANVLIDGASSAVTLSRNTIGQSFGYGVRVEPGAHDVTVTTNQFFAQSLASVSVSAGTGIAVTSNSFETSCGAVALDGSAAATVENNFVRQLACTRGAVASIQVAADSVATVASDYNATVTATGMSRYSWGGTSYATAAALTAATGQGGHDIDLPKAFSGDGPPEGSPLIDSADMNAPGQLDTDVNGRPRVDDPLAANSGTGSSVADRGAVEHVDAIGVTLAVTPTTGPAPLTSTFDLSAISSTWSEPVTAAVDFGDGSDPVPAAAAISVPHVYAKPGRYLATVTMTDTSGVKAVRSQQIVAGTPDAVKPSLSIGPNVYDCGGRSDAVTGGVVDVAVPVGDAGWQVTSRKIEWGDGLTSNLGLLTETWNHQYSAPGVYTVTMTDIDVLGRTTKATGTAVVGALYQTVGNMPIRDFDSRQRGVPLAAHGSVRLSLADLHAPYSFIDSVQLTVTVTNAKRAGYLSVSPDGPSQQVSTLNFAAGQTVANSVRATVGRDGAVYFYNGSGGTIDLVVDTFGMDVRNTGGATYSAVSPVRVLDTRAGVGAPTGKIPARGSVTVSIGGSNGVPMDAQAVAVNIATTNTTTPGFLTAYADGKARPVISNSNWAAGATVSNLSVVPMSGGKIVLYNGGTGPVDFVVDVVGHYDRCGNSSTYLPLPPVRVMDTRTGTGTGGHVARLAPGATLRLPLYGLSSSVLPGTTAVALNLTATNATASGWLAVYPDSPGAPTTSSLNYVAGGNVANMAIVPIGANQTIDVHNGGRQPVDVIIDLTGSFFTYPVG